MAVALIALATGILFASAAKAHGPNLFVGTTVHFNNKEWMPGGHTVVDTTGKVESPPLEKVDEGWHYTFDEVGTFELFVKQHPMAKARINVVPKKD
jgi:plastocyanin